MSTQAPLRGSDPITVAVVDSALRAIAWEMSEALRRSSHSPIIREMYDYSCAVFTPAGETVAQDELIPAFLGAMAATMPFVVRECEADTAVPGVAFMTNDPYRGGTHTPDIQVFVPVLHEGRLVAWCGNIAHHSDLGGTNPGTEGYANRSIFEEGLRIPPIRFATADGIDPAILRLLETNVRDPISGAGDLRAQLAAARLGRRRMGELIERYGPDTLGAAMASVLDASERGIRAAVSERPDGTGHAEGWLDDDGLGGEPVRIAASVSVTGDRVGVDLTGTSGQLAGGMNMSETAARAAIYFVVKALFLPDAPQNGAVLRTVDIVLPEGSLANPRFPAAVSLRHLAVQRLADTLIRAFSGLYPDLEVGGSFIGFSSLAAACRHPRLGNPVVIQDDLGGGMGGHAGGDGLSAVDVYLGNVQQLPAEMCEQQYPVRITETELVRDSGGPGRFRGGLGIRRVYEFLDEADGVFYSEQTLERFAPHGVHGGHAGTAARLVIERADGTEVEVTKRRLTVGPGDRLVVVTGGGGGFGDPRERDRAAVLADLREERVGVEAAARVYGLRLDEHHREGIEDEG